MITTQLRELWSPGVVDGWRCLICGENIDPVIRDNRKGQSGPAQTRARVPGTPRASYTKRRLLHEHC